MRKAEGEVAAGGLQFIAWGIWAGGQLFAGEKKQDAWDDHSSSLRSIRKTCYFLRNFSVFKR